MTLKAVVLQQNYGDGLYGRVTASNTLSHVVLSFMYITLVTTYPSVILLIKTHTLFNHTLLLVHNKLRL